jgi:glycosyltransferase involved in cell wall biosynthesis
VSGLEALAMGIPTIADATPDAEEWIERLIGYIPYYKASPKELPDAIEALLSDDALYNEYAEKGLEYIRQFHDYLVVARKYVEICERVCLG